MKHGLYSKYAPPSLKRKIEEAEKNPEVQLIETQILFQTGLLLEFLSDMKENGRHVDAETVSSLLKISHTISTSIEKNWRIEKETREILGEELINRFIDKVVSVLKEIVRDERIPRKGITHELAKRIAAQARTRWDSIDGNR
ncbi:MAG: hypothetical protein V3U24_05730 [Candidatus Neomarinimicrobiota bacterium]